MIFIQQYLLGLAFFGVLAFLLGLIRKFRELKKVTRIEPLTSDELRQVLTNGISSFGKMLLWWTLLFGCVIGTAFVTS
jgi:hypothetical protein